MKPPLSTTRHLDSRAPHQERSGRPCSKSYFKWVYLSFWAFCPLFYSKFWSSLASLIRSNIGNCVSKLDAKNTLKFGEKTPKRQVDTISHNITHVQAPAPPRQGDAASLLPWLPASEVFLVSWHGLTRSVILTRDLSDFCTVIFGGMCLWRNQSMIPKRNFYISETENELIL